MKTCPPRDLPPCDPLPPGRELYTLWRLVGIHRPDLPYRPFGTTMAELVAACADPAELSTVASQEAVHCAGFFQTLLMTDPLGRVVGQWSSTTMGRKPEGDCSSTPRTLRPPLVLAVVDLAGVPEHIEYGPAVYDGWPGVQV